MGRATRLPEMHLPDCKMKDLPVSVSARGLLICVAVLAAFAAPGWAQKAPRLQLFGGYSYLRFDSTTLGFADYSNLQGGELSGAFNVSRNFGFVADFSDHFGNHIRLYQYSFGPQFMFQHGRLTAFGHVLFGKANDHISLNGVIINSGRAIVPGVGFDYYISPRYSIRVVQADYLDTHTFNTGQGNLRISTGIVLHWGRAK